MRMEVSELVKRRRMGLFILPLVVLIPVTFVFYKVQGWNSGKSSAGGAGGVSGLNMGLPAVVEKAKGVPVDKLALYARADLDSQRMAERRKLDPYADSLAGGGSGVRGLDTAAGPVAGVRGLGRSAADKQAERVLRQVEEMQRTLRQGSEHVGVAGVNGYGGGYTVPVPSAPVPAFRASGGGRRDPELDQLNGMLDKLIRVQHPDGGGLSDTSRPAEPPLVVTVVREEGESDGGFMEIGGEAVDSIMDREPAIPAIVAADQTLVTGSTVELRLGRTVMIAGHAVVKDQAVYGLATLRGERLEIVVHSLRSGDAILPVNLEVYDLDGLSGIRVPGALTREVSKESAGEALNGLGMMSADPSLGAQAASAGVQLARSVAARKLRLVRVALPAGYRVLLKNIKR